jgi:hypothetical protein
LIALALVGCGGRTAPNGDGGVVSGSDAGGGGGGGCGRIDDITARLDHPTGFIDSAATARGVADAYAELLAEAALAARPRPADRRSGINCEVDSTTGQTTCVCTGGGALDVTACSDGQSFHYVASRCCQSAGCCYDGTVDLLMDPAQGATYTLCYETDIDISGCSNSAAVNLSYCEDSMGRLWYLVPYQGATYAVSGSYTSGVGGDWTVRDASTTWNCTEGSSGAGRCDSAAGGHVEWT